MDAAVELVAVHGFDALRLRDVARRAGVSIGLIQHYFDTRDELLFEAMDTAGQRRAEQWTQLAEGAVSAREKLRALLEGSVNDRHRCVVWLETCAAATRHPQLKPGVRLTQEAWRSALRAVIDEGVSAGEFTAAIPPNDIVAVLVSLIDGLMLAAATEDSNAASQDHRVRLLRGAAQRLLPGR